MKKTSFFIISFILFTTLQANITISNLYSSFDNHNSLQTTPPLPSFTYGEFNPYLTNVTLDQVDQSDILCIDIGDADNDGDNDIVLGTYPHGLVILYENVGNQQSIEFVPTLIANFSSVERYGVYPVRVNDVVIDDLEGTGNNSILVGTWYFTYEHNGDVTRFEKLVTGWEETEILNGISNPILGGVYSISVGKIGSDSSSVVVVGQGGAYTLDYAKVKVYRKESSVWTVEDVVMTNQSRIDTCIGDFSSVYEGNEIIYCTYTDNSTLGYVGYETGKYYSYIIDNYTIGVADPPPYTRFMNVNIGDFEGDGKNELVVAIETDTMDSDSIKIYNETNKVTIAENMEFIGADFEFSDFDNDGLDEFVWVNTTTTTYPVSSIHYYDWNGISGETFFLENSFETYVPTICIGDVDNDGDLELLYGTEGNGWLILWDYVSLPFEQNSMLSPVVSLIAGPFSVLYQVGFFGWSTYDIVLTIDLPDELIAQGQSTSVYLGDRFIPGIVSNEWQITALDYGLFNIDLITNTTNAGENYTTTSVQVTDLEVYNAESSSSTASIGQAITISGQIVYIHDKSPVENAVVCINGESAVFTDDSGLFSFQRTELTTGTKTYNITASLEGEYDFDDCAIYKILEVEWLPPVSEYSMVLFALVPILMSLILQAIEILRKKRKQISLS